MMQQHPLVVFSPNNSRCSCVASTAAGPSYISGGKAMKGGRERREGEEEGRENREGGRIRRERRKGGRKGELNHFSSP